MSITTDANQQIVVLVAGGGPVGLTFALNLTMMMGKNAKIIIYEGRWFVDDQRKMRWQDEEQGKTRRDQVVTLQDHVIEQMPNYIKQGLFRNIEERVWPTSRNIPIREVEDRLFDLLKPFVSNGQIELVPENLNEQSECLIKGNFDILVGADGANSFVRRYCNIQMISEGLEYACGVAYNIPDDVPSSEAPLDQAMNCVLTVSQTRYLVNSSTSRHGYLNIRLIQDEYDELRNRLQTFEAKNDPIDLLDYNKCPQSPVWTIIRQGLDFFRISPKYVFRVIPIEINVRHASIVVRELRFEIGKSEQKPSEHDEKKYKTALAFLAGDAAMCVHFWPGRGMNSGMKAAMALARNIVRTCTSKNSINIRKPLRFLDFLDYEGFMSRLRAREQQGRSLRVLVDPIDKSVEESYSYAHLGNCYKRYTKKLIRKLKETRDRLEKLDGWPHHSRPISDEQLEYASNRIAPHAVAQLSLANPWPTREMSGVEVLVENTFPYDLRNAFPVPVTASLDLKRAPSLMILYKHHVLWVTGDKQNEGIDILIKDIRNLQNASKTFGTTHSNDALTTVKTVEEVEQWVTKNQVMISQPNIIFKVVTLWTIGADKTAIDVIRAVRAKLSRAPVLIFTNKIEEIQAAVEFPNVVVTDAEVDVKEFVGVRQETLWNTGYRVSYIQDTAQGAVYHTPKLEKVSTTEIKKKSIVSSELPYPLENFSQPSMPAVPNASFFQFHLPSSLPKLSSSSHVDMDRLSISKPMLLWVDSSDNDRKLKKEIEKNHPTLEIQFKPTYKEAEEYLTANLRDIQGRDTVIIVCRGFYSAEGRSYTDVAQLLDTLNLGELPMAVYTRSVTMLLERTPNHPKRVEIFDKQSALLAFINRYLQSLL
ncbi:unnamed protein product [Rotaria magnacalcarata]|uniref:Uncharacterized protein n=4 Tax=Rotaria magnacalcarata TaxID=392030 RepID=A0A816RT49_9BILA|nr:unnamed protein product [Rotaria magnacalcarata]